MKRLVPIIGSIILSVAAVQAHADHMNSSILDMLRVPINAFEGYLGFQTAGHGAEYTGHTDKDGKDFSDNYFTIKPIIVTASNGVGPNNAGAAALANDLDYTRKIYAQAGLSVRTEAQSAVGAAQFAGIGDDPWVFAERVALSDNGSGRSGNADTVNIYYVHEFDPATANGITLNDASAAGNPYTFLRDNRQNNTHAHEIGHMLFNGPIVHDEIAGDTSHSSDTTNLMYTTGGFSSATLTDVGPKIDGIGNHDILTGPQIQAIHGNPGAGNPGYIKHGEHVNTHGDRADFDWVTDQRIIESSGSGNGADLNPGVDYLVWQIGGVDASTHTGPSTDNHDHNALGELDLPAFAGTFFKTVDVVSNINRYADNDTDLGNPKDAEEIRRAKALDYHTPEFSIDGSTWVTGSLVNVYKRGWTGRTGQEDYTARWSTDIEAKFVRISAVGVDVVGHDGNTQIDAVIAAPYVRPYVPKRFQVVPGFSTTDSSLTSPPIYTEVTTDNSPPTVPIEIVSLSLQSAQPITVQAFSGGGLDPAPTLAYHFDTALETAGPFQVNGLLQIFNEFNQLGTIIPSGVNSDLFHTDFTDSFFDITFQVEIPGRRPQWYLVHGELLDPVFAFDFVAPFPAPSASIIGLDMGISAGSAFSGEFMQWTVTAAEEVPEPVSVALFAIATIVMIGRRRGAGVR